MINKEFNLSEEQIKVLEREKKLISEYIYPMGLHNVQTCLQNLFVEIRKKDKEFIRRLKELKGIVKHKTILNEIDKLAGDKLNGGLDDE